MQWYYAIDGQQHGPVEMETLQGLVGEGKLRSSDLVWNEAMGAEWAPAGSRPDLFPAEAGAEAPPSGAPAGTGGATPNRDLMAQAREALRGKWGMGVVTVIIVYAIGFASGFVPCVGPIVSLFVSGPLTVGWFGYFLLVARGREARIADLFGGFSQFGPALGAYLLVTLFTVLWTLLLIVPGIVAVYRYSMTWLILAENPGIGPLEAIRQSTAMMTGRKWKLFCLQWRFFGWGLLCLLTLGIGFLWLTPYMMASVARFYDDAKEAA